MRFLYLFAAAAVVSAERRRTNFGASFRKLRSAAAFGTTAAVKGDRHATRRRGFSLRLAIENLVKISDTLGFLAEESPDAKASDAKSPDAKAGAEEKTSGSAQKTSGKESEKEGLDKQARIKALEEMKDKLTKIKDHGMLKDDTLLKNVLSQITSVLDRKDSLDAKALGAELDAVREDIKALKDQLVKKAEELQSQFKKKRTTIISESKDAIIFEKLLDVQDAPLSEQFKILKKYPDSPAAKQMLANKYQEGANLAMEFGGEMDKQKTKLLQQKKDLELKKLAESAHVSTEKAKTLMPILSNLERQERSHHHVLRDIDSNLHKIEETERFYKKQRGVEARQEHVLRRAIKSIREGDIKEVNQAMKQLQDLK